LLEYDDVSNDQRKVIYQQRNDIIDAKEMPPRTKRALEDLEDNGLATFDMEDEMFEELDFESL
jgi:preprotein translocase subunit SecA